MRLLSWLVPLVAAGLAGCASRGGSELGPAAAQVPMAGGQTASASAIYGETLTPGQYTRLVSGNTLFRPLALGGRTVIYVAPDQSLKLRVKTNQGQTGVDSGREVVSKDEVCWLWHRIGKQCFHYYWDGRLLTLVDVSGHMLPAQFLVQKGDSEAE